MSVLNRKLYIYNNLSSKYRRFYIKKIKTKANNKLHNYIYIYINLSIKAINNVVLKKKINKKLINSLNCYFYFYIKIGNKLLNFKKIMTFSLII